MKVLVIGAGMYVLGRGTAGLGTVLPALAQVSKSCDIEGVTICSTSVRAASEVSRAAAEVNRRLGTNLNVEHAVVDELLDAVQSASSFDCAIVSVPDDLHFALGSRVLEAGLHCLIVKPFVPSVAEARELIALADKHGCYGAVELHKRYDEANLIVRRMLQEGKLGKIAYATVEYSQRITVPRDAFALWASRTNIFQYLGVHYVDLLYFMTGYRPRRAMAVGHRGVLSRLSMDTYDSVHAIVTWDAPQPDAEPFVSQFAIGWIDPERSSAISDQRYVMVGSDGRIECDQKNRGLRLVSAARGVEDLNPYFSEYLAAQDGTLEFSGYGFQSIERFLLDVRDLKQGRTEISRLQESRPSFRSALASTAVIQAVRESLNDESTWKEIDDAL